MSNSIKLSKKQKYRLKNYKRGDVINISTINYASLHRNYVDELNIKTKNKYRSFQAIKDSEQKPNRPVVILYNDIHSNLMIIASLTTKKHYLNFNVGNDNINYQVLLFNKKRHKSTFDGMVFKHINNETMNLFLETMKRKRPKTYKYYLEQKTKIQEKVIEKLQK